MNNKTKATIKIVAVVLLITLIAIFTINLINKDDTTTLVISDMTQTEVGVYTNINIPEGTYEVGDMFYITYTEVVEESFLDTVLFDRVSALEDGDIIAMYELTQADVENLQTTGLEVELEVMLTQSEIDLVGMDKVQKGSKLQQLKNSGELEKHEIQNNYQVKRMICEEQKNEAMNNFENGNSDENGNADNTNSDENGNANDAGNSDDAGNADNTNGTDNANN
jgi:hypothetical protein